MKRPSILESSLCALLVLVAAGARPAVAADAATAPRAPAASRGAAAGPSDSQSTLMRALNDELARSMSELSLPGMPRPYYLSYTVVDYEQLTMGSQFGALVTHDRERARFLRVSVRVGSAALDNTNLFGDFRGFERPVQLPVDDDYGALRRRVWLATDDAYKDAVEALEKKRAALSTQAASADEVGDFSPAPAARTVEPPAPLKPDEQALAAMVRDASAVYREFSEVQSGKAALLAATVRRVFVSSDGAFVDEPRRVVRFDARGDGQASDGMELQRLVSFTATSIDRLPKPAAIVDAVRASARELAAARKAPLVQDYAGPVLFEPRAAAQLLRALMAEQFSGSPAPRGGDPRMMAGMDGLESDFTSRLGQRVLPAGFSVVDDPSRADLAGQSLLGSFHADDEGVPAQSVQLVSDGMLKTLLMTRAPRREVKGSNGHARVGLSGAPRARPANLVFTTSRGLDSAELKRRLITEVKATGLQYGILVRSLAEPALAGEGGGFAHDDAGIPQPVELVKVGLDGKEEVVRGGTLGGLQVRTLKTVVAAGRDPAVLSYFASASGGPRSTPIGGMRMALWGLPTSLAAPALLFPDLDVRRTKAPQSRTPVMARPDLDGK